MSYTLGCMAYRIANRQSESGSGGLPRGDLPVAIRAIAELRGGGGGHPGLGRAGGAGLAADRLDPVGQVQDLAIGLVVEVEPPVGVAAQDHGLDRDVVAPLVDLVP